MRNRRNKIKKNNIGYTKEEFKNSYDIMQKQQDKLDLKANLFILYNAAIIGAVWGIFKNIPKNSDTILFGVISIKENYTLLHFGLFIIISLSLVNIIILISSQIPNKEKNKNKKEIEKQEGVNIFYYDQIVHFDLEQFCEVINENKSDELIKRHYLEEIYENAQILLRKRKHHSAVVKIWKLNLYIMIFCIILIVIKFI